MRIFDIVENGVLEEIFKNTANKIFCDQWDAADPDHAYDSFDFQKQKELEKRVSALIKKEWYDLLDKYNIQQTPVKNFRKIFYKNKYIMLESFSDKMLSEKLSLDEIYNQHLRYDDKVAVMEDDSARNQDWDHNKPGDYPVFLLDQETVAKIAVGYDILKRDGNVTISQVIEAAGDYSYEVVKTDIKYEDLPVLREIVIDKIKTEITKNDEYYFHSTSEYEKTILFLQHHKIQIINDFSLERTFNQDQWMAKDEDDYYYYCFFKNLHLFDLKGCLYKSARQAAERPDSGFVCIHYKDKSYDGNYLFVPKDLASAWLKESLVNA